MQISTYLIDELFLNPIYQYVFIGFIVISSFSLLFKFTRKSNLLKKSDSYEYRVFERLLSPAEHSFFMILKKALSNEYEIFAQVRVADVLEPKQPKYTRERQVALNKITSKHFDYLICDKQTLSIVAVIELDDKSHQLEDRKNRDIFLDRACQSAGLKLIRFPCKSEYQLNTIREKIFKTINSVT